MESTTVECDLVTDLPVPPQDSVPVLAGFRYRAGDPYAVRVAFHVDATAPVTWRFARDLLVDGVFRAVGEGDVRIRPVDVAGRRTVTISLVTAAGGVCLRAPASSVAARVGETLELVPPGTEHRHLSVDAVETFPTLPRHRHPAPS